MRTLIGGTVAVVVGAVAATLVMAAPQFEAAPAPS